MFRREESEIPRLHYDDEPKGPEASFKVDLRLVLKRERTLHDLAVAEFARYFRSRKLRHDHAKLLVEAKEVADRTFSAGCDSHQVLVPVIQICGRLGFHEYEYNTSGNHVCQA